jgi:hypothetical protein
MKIRFGRHFSSIVLGLMVLGLMGPAALRAQSGQTPSNSNQSTDSSQTTPTKKSKKSKSSSTNTSGGTSGSTSGGGTAGSTAAPASSAAAAPSVTSHPATADQKGTSTTRTSAAGSTPPSPGMVWVNTSTKVYHKSGSKYYGNTKQGKWMTEADAQKAGYKAASN